MYPHEPSQGSSVKRETSCEETRVVSLRMVAFGEPPVPSALTYERVLPKVLWIISSGAFNGD